MQCAYSSYALPFGFMHLIARALPVASGYALVSVCMLFEMCFYPGS